MVLCSCMALKTCTRCKVDKPLEDFNKRAKAKDGRRHTCRACDSEIRAGADSRPQPEAPSKPVLVPFKSPSVDSVAPCNPPEDKVAGRIEPAKGTQITEATLTNLEAEESRAAKLYAKLLNRKLSIRKRADIMVSIAQNHEGFAAALALKALNDINLATGVVSKSGQKVDLGPLFVLPEGSDVKMTG